MSLEVPETTALASKARPAWLKKKRIYIESDRKKLDHVQIPGFSHTQSQFSLWLCSDMITWSFKILVFWYKPILVCSQAPHPSSTPTFYPLLILFTSFYICSFGWFQLGSGFQTLHCVLMTPKSSSPHQISPLSFTLKHQLDANKLHLDYLLRNGDQPVFLRSVSGQVYPCGIIINNNLSYFQKCPDLND